MSKNMSLYLYGFMFCVVGFKPTDSKMKTLKYDRITKRTATRLLEANERK